MTGHEPPSGGPPAPLLAPAITLGVATAVAMWGVGFLSHFPGAVWPAPLTGVVLLLTQIGGGVLAGRSATGRAALVGASAGLITAALNLLILGGYLQPAGPGEEAPASPAMVSATYLVASVTAGALAALLGSTLRKHRPEPISARRWLARYAIVAFVAFVPVLLSGGIVTSAEAGLAVPDWPGSYNELMWLYPVSKMTGGIYFEHAHRLFGMLAGLSTAILLLFTLIVDRRWLARGAVIAVSALVIAQAILGGLRVTTADDAVDDAKATTTSQVPDAVAFDYALTADNTTSTALAMLHGMLGQLTFASLAAIAVILATRFWNNTDAPRRPDRLLRTATTALLLTLAFQLLLGVATRHLQHFHVMMTHLGFAAFVTIAALVAGLRATAHAEHRQLRVHGYVIVVIVILQVALGFLTMLAVLPYDDPEPDSPGAIALATAHHGLGAALLALATIIFVWARRLTTAR